MNMTIEDVVEYRKNALKILENNGQYATAKAVNLAFGAMIAFDQVRWERDIAIEQLEELGLSLGQKVDGVYLSKEEYDEMLEYMGQRP